MLDVSCPNIFGYFRQKKWEPGNWTSIKNTLKKHETKNRASNKLKIYVSNNLCSKLLEISIQGIKGLINQLANLLHFTQKLTLSMQLINEQNTSSPYSLKSFKFKLWKDVVKIHTPYVKIWNKTCLQLLVVYN